MNALEEENEQLVLQIQQAHHQIQDLQVQLAKLESHQQDIQPLILKLCRQQEKISSLEYSIVETQKLNEQLKIQNAKLLALAKSEKKLQEDNENLKKLNLQQSKILEQKKGEIENLTRQVKILTDEIPTAENYKDLISVANHAKFSLESVEEKLSEFNIVNKLNFLVIGVFFVLTILAGWQISSLRDDLSSAETKIEKVRKGIYNSRGWSVLEGAQNNEWVFSQEQPELYKQWLEYVKQN